MNIFITGASGFVGGAAARYFKARAHTITAMSRSESSDLKIAAAGATPHRCQLGNVPVEALHGCDAVIHAAAFVEDWGSRNDFYAANVAGTRQLLEAAQAAGVKKFIHIGTEAALWYGQDILDADETYPYAEQTPFLYSETKREAEKLVLAANQPGLFETISLRPRMIWGPGDQTILPKALDMYRKKRFQWIGKGAYKTSSTHIDNLTEGIRLAMEKGRGGEAYFITDDETSTFRDFFTKLFATQGIQLKAGSIPKWLARGIAALLTGIWKLVGIKTAPPLTRHTAALMSSHCTLSSAKAKLELGYQPLVTVEAGMNAMPKIV